MTNLGDARRRFWEISSGGREIKEQIFRWRGWEIGKRRIWEMFFYWFLLITTVMIFKVDDRLFRWRLWELRGIRVPELGITSMLHQFGLVGSFFKNLYIKNNPWYKKRKKGECYCVGFRGFFDVDFFAGDSSGVAGVCFFLRINNNIRRKSTAIKPRMPPKIKRGDSIWFSSAVG